MLKAALVKVATVSELSSGDMRTVEVGGDEVLLANVDGTV